jgi:nucleotide-binding universal stress UspA family protein
MALYRRILVPVDGSSTSMRGLREALRLAKSQGAKLWLLHVLDEFYLAASPEMAVEYNSVVNALKAGGRRVLAKAQARARAAGVKSETLMPEIVVGRAGHEIVRQAKKVRADLIVLGTHGRRGLKRLALGSDAEQVVRNSAVPVLLVRAG